MSLFCPFPKWKRSLADHSGDDGMVRYSGGLLLAFSVLAGSAFASSDEISKRLIGALTCKGEPMTDVQKLSLAGTGRLAEGFVGYRIGDDIDMISGVALTAPLQFGATQTDNIVASSATIYDGFSALVHARFEGDYRPIVAELKLRQSKSGESFKRAVIIKGTKAFCPKTIELLPQKDGHFLLGCGWCPG
jgi:hypothetical protein